MKIEVDLEDNIYHRAQEIFGADVDLGRVMAEMLSSILIIYATYPEDFMAVFTRQASPEQRQRIDNAMAHQASKALERAKKLNSS